MTEKLYYQDVRQFEFEATVLEAGSEDGKCVVVLDRTCFYPEGGGQPADQGWIDKIRVTDVRKKGEKILHFVDSLPTSGTIKGKVDSDRRRDFMQQHTGQHILSQALVRVGKYPTVSVHFGEDYTTIEINAPDIPEADLQSVEKLANQIIHSDLPVSVQWVDPEKVQKIKIRRPAPDVEKVRIVRIGDFDSTACGGTHLEHTGEVGLIKIIGKEKIRGRPRIVAKIGGRAFDDYQQKNLLVQNLLRQLSCGESDIVPRIDDLLIQAKEKERQISRLESRIMAYEAETAVASAETVGKILLITKVFEDANMAMLKAFADEILTVPDRMVVGLSGQNEQVWWFISHSADSAINLLEIVPPRLELIEGKGGGSETRMQGGAKNGAGIQNFITEIRNSIEQEQI